MAGQPATTVDEYVAGFPDGPRQVLEQVAATLRDALPGAEERIRYGMPAFRLGGDRYWLHFAGWKKHVGLYPVPVLDGDLEAQVAPHRAAKDTVQLFYAEPLPRELLTRVAVALAARHA